MQISDFLFEYYIITVPAVSLWDLDPSLQYKSPPSLKKVPWVAMKISSSLLFHRCSFPNINLHFPLVGEYQMPRIEQKSDFPGKKKSEALLGISRQGGGDYTDGWGILSSCISWADFCCLGKFGTEICTKRNMYQESKNDRSDRWDC